MIVIYFINLVNMQKKQAVLVNGSGISFAEEEGSTRIALDRIGSQDLDSGKPLALTGQYILVENSMTALALKNL